MIDSPTTNAAPPAGSDTHALRLRMFAAMALTYLSGLLIVTRNPLYLSLMSKYPIILDNLPYRGRLVLYAILLVIGRTPLECLTHVVIAAIVIQGIKCFASDDAELDPERYRPYVFWRAVLRFTRSIWPFLSRTNLDAPPSSSLTEYERVTVRYFAVKLLFLPSMISFFFGNLQAVISNVCGPMGPVLFTVPFIRHFYLACYMTMMLADVAWFAIGCAIETGKYSPIVTVDPYAAGWVFNMACYPPLVTIFGQAIVWSVPEYPVVGTAPAALFYCIVGLILFTFYVVADFSFGLKTGNLVYRGLVDKGPFRLIRHPMYASKNLAWVIFTIPALNFHMQRMLFSVAGHHLAPILPAANWLMIPPMIAWVGIYAGRALGEERYLLNYPEYRDYCKRVRYRFIPGVF